MAIFKCKMCGADLPLEDNSTVCECEYCGTTQTVPTADNDKKMNLFNRANRLRFANEFDKAAGVFESIVSEFPEEAEAYWGLCLCKYGIEYVDDPATARKIPTCHRTSYDSIFDDTNFEMALEYADVVARKVYRDEAKEIDRLQKSILEIAKNEEPFDIFICYKETANDGQRTIDSVLAQDIYDNLTEKGYKVFFARITLEDKLGQEYEPYIFSALSSAKVMLVVGTDYEYFNAVWVKNEWSRFLDMMKTDKKKTLIPCYKDIDAYDIPNEFRHLQAQDMGKVGFMQDLIRGIGKIFTPEEHEKTVVQNTVHLQQTPQNATVDSLLERAFMFLEDGEWSTANEYCDKALDISPKCAKAYVGKLLADRKLNTHEELHFTKSGNADGLFTDPIENNQNYKKALRFADGDLKKELEKDAADNAEEYNRRRYEKAKAAMNEAVSEDDFNSVAEMFGEISYYRDSQSLIQSCLDNAEQTFNETLYNRYVGRFKEAKTEEEFTALVIDFSDIEGYKDTDEYITKCREKAASAFLEKKYRDALNMQKINTNIEMQRKAMKQYEELEDYKDSAERADMCRKRIEELEREAENKRIAAERAAAKKKKTKRVTISSLAAAAVLLIVYITVLSPIINYKHAISLLNDEPLEALSYFMKVHGYKDSDEYVERWRKSCSVISTGLLHTAGLKKDGTVVAAGNNEAGQCAVYEWADIVAISAGEDHTVGLKKDGTVIATGSNEYGQCDVSEWTDIVSISAGSYHTIGLKKDGTAVVAGTDAYGKNKVLRWRDIVAVSAGEQHTVGLKKDGTVVAVGSNKYGQCNVSGWGWKDIVSVSAGFSHTVGLKKDGTVVATGFNYFGQCSVSDWKDIVSVSASSYHTVGLKKDGTVVATGGNGSGQCSVSDWKDIVSVSAGDNYTVGLKKDGTVVAAGWNEQGQCDVSDWKDIKLPSFD